MSTLFNINRDGAYDGQPLSLENFQAGLEDVLTMSQLVGKPAEERKLASVMLDILAGTKNKTAAEVAEVMVTEAPQVSGQGACARCLQQTLLDEPKWLCVKTRRRMVHGRGPGCARG